MRVFDEEPLNIETVTPKIECDTAKVYQKYRADYLKNIDIEFAQKLSKLSSKEILNSYEAKELNDLFIPCLDIYKELSEFKKPNWFLAEVEVHFLR